MTLEEANAYFEANPWVPLTAEEFENPGDINLQILSRQARRAGVPPLHVSRCCCIQSYFRTGVASKRVNSQTLLGSSPIHPGLHAGHLHLNSAP